MIVSSKFLMACRIIDYYSKPGRVMTNSMVMAKDLGVPRRQQEQTLQALVHERILTSKRGPTGHYAITDYGRQLNLYEVFEHFCPPGDQWFLRMIESWKFLKPKDLAKARRIAAKPRLPARMVG